MEISTVPGTPTYSEPPRSTAYYYGDLEKIKRQNSEQNGRPRQDGGEPQARENEFELSEYADASDVINDGAIREVPPFRDRYCDVSPPEYSTPEGIKETYSTAGTFPMPEQKEKEPLLAELEIVGRVPLTQLDSGSGVRRSRSWYLCCPNVGDEEISRESSWRYSSLRPITAPPAPTRNGLSTVVLPEREARSECEALAAALAAERARAAAAARAHSARLAELHAVIAELVRRHRAAASAAIREEDADECESTTQPAGELDGEPSETDQIDSSSLSPDALPLDKLAVTDDVTDDVTTNRLNPAVLVAGASGSEAEVETSNVSDTDSKLCADKRCSPASCQRERGSPDGKLYIPAGSLQYRRCKLASRVTLPRTGDCEQLNSSDETQCEAAQDNAQLRAAAAAAAARAAHLAAENCTLRHALSHANDTQHRLRVWCAAQESSCVCVCAALSAADRALECYDVLLALRESSGTDQRVEAERVALSLLRRLQASPSHTAPLLSPGPWADTVVCSDDEEWSAAAEAALRAHCARLKTDTVTLRHMAAPPALYSHYDAEEQEQDGESVASRVNMADMEDAVDLEERTLAAEARAAALLAAHTHKSDSASRRRRKERHKHTHTHNETQL